MAQNIYDNEDFFKQYGQLPRSVHGLDGAAEWPTLKKLVGDVNGSEVLDLGSGMGWFCRWAAEHGANHVLGVEISQKMLDKAASFDSTSSLKAAAGTITYEQGDLEKIELPEEVYDVVYSSLTLHYLPSVGSLFGNIFKALRPGGRFVFSIEHPVMTAPRGPAFDGAYKRHDNGDVFWPLNSYSIEGLRETEWLGAKGVRKYHRPVETYLNALIQSGFVLTAVRESWDGMERNPKSNEEDWGGHRPFFLLVAAEKPKAT